MQNLRQKFAHGRSIRESFRGQHYGKEDKETGFVRKK